MKQSKLILIAALFSAVSSMWGCYPAGPDFVEELDVVYTTYDEDYNFQSRSTYAMPDKIVVDIEIDFRGDTTFVYMDDEDAAPILASIESNMSSYGWTKVDPDNDPDMLMLPAGISSTTYYYSYWYDWWYGGWYPGWWGWYYPPYYSVGSYTTGSLILVLTDPNTGQNSPINQSAASWISVSNGILTYYNDINRVIGAIDQSFMQSSYLKVN